MGEALERESKVTYTEGDNIRTLNGVIEDDPDDKAFILVKRRDGIVKINKQFVVKIEKG